jgi:pimeloyl-ACP methyl ester carboxylesterase
MPQPKATVEVVDPVWLLKALGISFAAAVVCAWLTVCLLFYQGEWQLVLHPSRVVDRTPSSLGVGYEAVRFDAGETGEPRLTGWWAPALAGSKYGGLTVLYLHDGTGSLSATVPKVARLHAAGLAVFAFDYRGFGESDAAGHPTEARMEEDSAAALEYLAGTRHLAAGTVIVYGVGLGGSLAAGLARANPGIAALVVDNPDPDARATAVAAKPSRTVPVGLLFRERFEIAGALGVVKMPKLLIAGGPNFSGGAGRIEALQDLYRRAASPKFAVTLPVGGDDGEYRRAVLRFLDEDVVGR